MGKKQRYSKPTVSTNKINFNFFSRSSKWNFGSLVESSVFLATCDPNDTNCSTTCFPVGTQILMANKNHQNIETIKIGDRIASYSIEEKKIKINTVSKLLIHPNDPDGYYIINGFLKVTGKHRVWTNNSKWEVVEKLKIGDSLLNSGQDNILIQSIKKIEGTNTVYNLHLNEKEHNYFAENILVHNYK